MFKTEDKVPEYYVNQSRDFQLLCLLLDLVENHITCGTLASDMIDDVTKVKDKLLNLFGSKLGFITKYPLSTDYLREIYKFFSKSDKYKGTSATLIDMQYLINQFSNVTDCKITNASEDGDEYKVTYYADVLINENMLYSLMRYLLPAGYNLGTELLKRKSQGIQQEIDYNEQLQWLLDKNVLDPNKFVGFDTARLSEIRFDSKDAPSSIIEFIQGNLDDLDTTNISDIKHRAINATDVGTVTNRVVGDVQNYHNGNHGEDKDE